MLYIFNGVIILYGYLSPPTSLLPVTHGITISCQPDHKLVLLIALQNQLEFDNRMFSSFANIRTVDCMGQILAKC